MSKPLKLSAVLFSTLAFIAVYALYPSASGTREFNALKVATFSKDFTNVFLVSKGNTHLLLDAGLAEHVDELETFLQDNNVSPNSLAGVILTHAHHDHAGTARYFQEKYGVKIIAGKEDLAFYQQGLNGKLCPTSFLANARHEMDQAGRFPALTPDILINQPTDLKPLVGLSGKIYNLPAHTPGSLMIVIENTAFLGDLIRGSILPKHLAAMHFYQCDLKAVQKGMDQVLNHLAPSVETFFPSHLGPVNRASMQKLLTRFEQ